MSLETANRTLLRSIEETSRTRTDLLAVRMRSRAEHNASFVFGDFSRSVGREVFGPDIALYRNHDIKEIRQLLDEGTEMDQTIVGALVRQVQSGKWYEWILPSVLSAEAVYQPAHTKSDYDLIFLSFDPIRHSWATEHAAAGNARVVVRGGRLSDEITRVEVQRSDPKHLSIARCRSLEDVLVRLLTQLGIQLSAMQLECSPTKHFTLRATAGPALKAKDLAEVFLMGFVPWTASEAPLEAELGRAIDKSDEQRLRLVLRKKPRFDEVLPDHHQSAIELAFHRLDKPGGLRCALMLIDCGADVLKQYLRHITPITSLFGYGRDEAHVISVLKRLFKRGLDPNATFKDIGGQKTLLSLAAQSQQESVVRFLLQAGADPNRIVAVQTHDDHRPLRASDFVGRNNSFDLTQRADRVRAVLQSAEKGEPLPSKAPTDASKSAKATLGTIFEAASAIGELDEFFRDHPEQVQPEMLLWRYLLQQPIQTKLSKRDSLHFRAPKQIESICAQYLKAGFTEAGRYVLETEKPVRIVGMVHKRARLYGAIYEIGNHRAFDVVRLHKNSGSITATSLAAPSVDVPRKKTHKLHRGVAGCTVPDLVRLIGLKDRRSIPVPLVSEAEFAKAFERLGDELSAYGRAFALRQLRKWRQSRAI